MSVEHEEMPFDVLFVGGGPACLAGAVRLMQLARENHMELEIALIEKGAEIGAHAVSGAILNPIALRELIPDYADRGCPVEGRRQGGCLLFPDAGPALPDPLHSETDAQHGAPHHQPVAVHPVAGRRRGGDGGERLSGLTGKEVLYGQDGRRIAGVRTRGQGDRQGRKSQGQFRARDRSHGQGRFRRGARGSLMKEIAGRLGIFAGREPPGVRNIKEVIQLPEDHFFKGSRANDIHTHGIPPRDGPPGRLGFIYTDNRKPCQHPVQEDTRK